MRPVVLDSQSVQTLLAGLVIEDLGNNDLGRDVLTVAVRSMRRAICRIALGETWRIAEAGRIEKWVRLVNPRVYNSDLDAGACGGSAARGSPGIRGIDDLVALAQVGMIERVGPYSLEPSARAAIVSAPSRSVAPRPR